MRVVTLTALKGGTGRSTLAINLAVAAREAGEKAILFDLDPQETVVGWAGIRATDDLPVVRLPVHDCPRLPDLLRQAASSYALAIIDTPAVVGLAVESAIEVASLCLVPLRPTRPDSLALPPTLAVLKDKASFAFVLNQCASGARNREAAEAQQTLRRIGPCAEPSIEQHSDYQHAFASGEGVTEYEPAGKAAGEMRALWRWTSQKLGSFGKA